MKVRYPLPNFSAQQTQELLQTHFKLSGELKPLPSERDQNFHLKAADGNQYVVKIANVAERREILDLQNAAMMHLATYAKPVELPRPVSSVHQTQIVPVEGKDGEPHFLRLLTFVPGTVLASWKPHSNELLESLGFVIGTIDAALQNFEHPAAERELKWDIQRADWIRDFLSYIIDSASRKKVERILETYKHYTKSRLAHVRSSVIYNDGNDYNILVRNGLVIGVIDFGDMLVSPTISDLAVAIAYASLNKPDPIATASAIVAGYHRAYAIPETELEILFSLICTRLAVSVTNSAYQRSVEPDNSYLTISEQGAWKLIDQLATVNPRYALYSFRSACGYDPCPDSPKVTRWLHDHSKEIDRVVDADLRTSDVTVYDLSVSGSGMEDCKGVGIGKYNEPRRMYTTDAFRMEGNEGPEWRTIHIGMDIFFPAGTAVIAPLDSTVHSFANNAAYQDYGPTIILEHQAGDVRFFTLYGHLSTDSLNGLHPGKQIKKGERFARIGREEENGGWTPHVHFQLILDMLDREGEFPGVALPSKRKIWLSMCPDPNLIVQIPATAFPPDAMTAEQILERRAEYLGKSLSISYQKPLHIVRGFLQYLYDQNGRAYLDAVNNVPHVGHCHPSVVKAAQQQMAVLNTNTRYLHESLVRYIERLCETLPEPLRVCFFVNSGSEANELALRLARTHTGRKETIVLEAGYHGNTSSLIEISSYKFDGPGGKGAPPHVFKAPMPDTYRGLYTDSNASAKYAEHIRAAIENGFLPGAFICESLLSCGGQIVLPANYLKQVYEYVRRAGGVCIADEVQVGFARIGSHFWGFQSQGVVPDIVTLGKPIANGHPMGAVITTPAIAASFANGMEFFSTFGGNPVSCAIGLAVLDVIRDEQLQQNAQTTGSYLLHGLSRLKERFPLVGDVRGMGLFVGIEFVTDGKKPAARQAAYIANRMKENSVLVSTDGPEHNVIKIKPPLIFTQANADQLLTALERILDENLASHLRETYV
jgi:4-aminobutyrate aminotransferase-like enzyme/Ser/Thr protein kinase RdoA (MazF antagonist)